jgi:hypothetical protein
LDNQNDECEHQQDVDESAQGVAADEAEQPKDEEDHKDCPEHFLPPKTLHIFTTESWTAWGTRQVVREIQNMELKAECEEGDLKEIVGQRFFKTAPDAGFASEHWSCERRRNEGEETMLLIILLIVLIFGFGYGGYRVGPGLGYYGGGGISLILTIVLILLLLRVI